MNLARERADILVIALMVLVRFTSKTFDLRLTQTKSPSCFSLLKDNPLISSPHSLGIIVIYPHKKELYHSVKP